MSGFYLAFALTVFGMLLYHLSQKSVPKETNPFFVIVIAYVVGIVMCIAFAVVAPGKKSLLETFRESNWAVYTLGVAAALIELGFLLAYRTGWRISIAAVATNAAAAIVLIPVGLIFFKDHLSLRNVIGLIFCLVGLALVVRQ
jgi:EamA-like transporter family.